MSTHCNSNPARKSTPRRPLRRPCSSARTRQSVEQFLEYPERQVTYLDFSVLGSREVLASFDGGDISSDGGALLLRKVEEHTGIIQQFAACFTDYRNPDLIEHLLEHLVAQRVYGLALGYEDLNDHDDLRRDPLLATVVGKGDPTGQSRERKRDRGKALAGKSTLNRMELTPVGADEEDRYKKITCHIHAVDQLFVALFLQAHRQPPEKIVLDLDATDDPIHGNQLRPLLSRLLQELLLSSPLYFLRRSSPVRPVTTLRHRCQRWGLEATPADHRCDPRGLAPGQDRDPWRQRVLPRANHGLV